jgi:hypothetical protein
LQGGLKLRAGDLDSRHQSKQNSRRHGYAECEEEHAGIQANRFHAGQRHAGGDQGQQAFEAPEAHCQASGPSRKRQQQTLREQLLQDAPPPRAQRRAQSDLAQPAVGPHQ